MAIAVLSSACSGNAQLPAQAVPADASARREAAATQLVYVSDQAHNVIAVFDRDGTPAGTITAKLDYPQGLFVDGGHHLWVANRGKSNVLEYARGANAPEAMLDDNGAQPEGVTMCPDGTVYVANILVSGGGDVAVFAHGSKHPTRTLNYEGGNFFFIACDASGNVFASLVLGTSGTVVEFPKARQAGAKALPIFMPGNPGGIAIDAGGKVLVDDPSGSGTITEYTESGTPTGVVIRTNKPWVQIALDRGGTLLLGATAHGGASVAFPSGAPRRRYRSKSFAQPIGIAIDPAL